MKLKRLCAISISAVALVTACGDDGDDSADESASTDGDTGESTTPADGSTDDSTGGDAGSDAAGCDATVAGTQIEYGTYAPTALLDPTMSSGALVGGAELAALYDVLFRYDYETNEFVPQLAESIESNDDRTMWTLTLREGIEYDDGTPLDAQLVADNMERFFAEGVRNTSAGFMSPIAETTVVDEQTLEFTLEFPWAEFPYVFADEPGMIVNTNAIGDDPEAFAGNPPPEAGVGPYVLERNAPNEEIVMKARDNYWGGPVCVETIRFTSAGGARDTYDAYRNDELDLAFLRDPAVDAEATEAGEEGLRVQQDNGLNVFINHREGRPGEDPRVREAVLLAADVDVINERSYQGELNPGKSLTQPESRFYSDAIEEAPTDPERAAELVEEAKADGYDGSIEILCQTDGPAQNNAVALEGMLEAVGFDVTASNQPVGDVIGNMVQGNYDLVCSGLGAGPETGMTAMLRALNSESPSNRMGYASEEMDAALLDLFAAATPEEQQAAMVVLNDLLIQDAAFLPLGALDESVIWKDHVQGVQFTVATIALFDDAYIDDAG